MSTTLKHLKAGQQALREAARINHEGVEAQVDYLRMKGGYKMLLEMAEKRIAENSS